jgi:hypothetical protein
MPHLLAVNGIANVEFADGETGLEPIFRHRSALRFVVTPWYVNVL